MSFQFSKVQYHSEISKRLLNKKEIPPFAGTPFCAFNATKILSFFYLPKKNNDIRPKVHFPNLVPNLKAKAVPLFLFHRLFLSVLQYRHSYR